MGFRDFNSWLLVLEPSGLKQSIMTGNVVISLLGSGEKDKGQTVHISFKVILPVTQLPSG